MSGREYEVTREIMNLADTISGEINRMCVTRDLAEFDTMYGHAKKNIEKLSKLIYDARFRHGGTQEQPEPTMEEFMYGQDMGNPEDGSL